MEVEKAVVHGGNSVLQFGGENWDCLVLIGNFKIEGFE